MDSTNTLPQILPSQAQKETTANALFAAASPAMLFAMDQDTTIGMTWGYLGGRWGGTLVANGSVVLPPNTTTDIVVELATGSVQVDGESPSLWDDPAYGRLYRVATNAAGPVSYEDHRAGARGVFGGGSAADDPDEGGGAGLQFFAEALADGAPNNSRPVVSLSAMDDASSVDIAILPKSNGAILAAVPDGTSTGGNKRGSNAIDLQRGRSSASQVASGNRSALLCGFDNSATGECAAVGSGRSNTASGDNAFAVGSSNTSSGPGSAACGTSNTTSGSQAFAAGRSNNAAGSSGFVHGVGGSDRGIDGTRVLGGTDALGAGGSQLQEMVLTRTLIASTAAVLTGNSSTPSTTNQLVLPNNSTCTVRGLVAMRRTDNGDSKCWEFTAAIKRGASAGDTAMLAVCTPTVLGADGGAAGWTLTVDADTTNGCLRVTAQADGVSGTFYYATCTLHAAQVKS